MRRTEALQGVRMIKFLEHFGPLRGGGVQSDGSGGAVGGRASGRFGAGASALRRRARRACWTVGSARRRASGFRSIGEAEVEALYRDALSRASRPSTFTSIWCSDHDFAWGYTWTKTFLHSKGLLEQAKRRGAHRRKRPRRPMPGMMLHQDGSRHAWLGGQPALDLIVTMDDATSAIYSAFLVEEEGTASTFRALAEVFGAHGLPLSLYTDRGSHYFHTPEAGGKVDREQSDAGRAGARASGRRAYRGLFAAGARALGAGVPDLAGPAGQGAGAGRDRHDRGGQRLHPRCLHPRPQRPFRGCGRAGRARPSWRSPASISTRSSASRRSARSATTIACPSTGSSCKSRKARCAPISSRRGSRCGNIPDGTHAVFHGPEMPRPLRQKRGLQTKKKRPPKSARRRSLWKCGQRKRVAHSPTGEQKQKKRTFDVLPKPAKLISYRHGRIQTMENH